MEDMKVTATGYDFRPAHAAMQRYVDGNLLSGFSSAVLVGRDLADVKCIGWADKEAQIPLRVDHIFRVFSNTKLITSCAALLLFEEGRFGVLQGKGHGSRGVRRSSRSIEPKPLCGWPERWVRPTRAPRPTPWRPSGA